MRRKLVLTGIAAAIVLGVGSVLAHNNVSDTVTPTDRIYADRFLKDAGYSDLISDKRSNVFADQVRTILAVQDAVLSRAPKDEPIDFDRQREPKDLYENRAGLCYDRSRVIEQILRRLGYEVRHAAVYSMKETGSAIVSLLTPQVSSHAVSEVETARGWILVDSNARWIGLTREGTTIDLEQLSDDQRIAGRLWDPRVKDEINEIFQSDFVYVFGLYSRHERFYPPYTAIPDINWGELVYDITG